MTQQTTKERPILFRGPMVTAILAGTKTQTRRVLKTQPTGEGQYLPLGRPHESFGWTGADWNPPIDCPYGRVGDRLWCREAWGIAGTSRSGPPFRQSVEIKYRADGETRSVEVEPEVWKDFDGRFFAEEGNDLRWRPSIHMPRWASRLLLEITDVRVQRVQAISDQDAYAEGVEMVQAPTPPKLGVPGLAPTFRHYLNPNFNGGRGVGVAHSFRTLWDYINGNRYETREDGTRHRLPVAWADNPFVWAVSFKRVEVGH